MDIMNENSILIFKEKQIRILIALLKQDKKLYISDIAKITGVTYVHTSRFLASCEKVGIILSEKHGRIKEIMLTKKGREITEQIQKITESIKTPLPDKKEDDRKVI